MTLNTDPSPNLSPRVTANLSPGHLRRQILQMALRGNSVHIACAFSIVEIVSVLCRDALCFANHRVDDPHRPRLVLSKGHGAMALYVAFAELGWIEPSDLATYMAEGSKLHGLCEAITPGIEVCSGSLGHGLPIAVGIAFGLKRQGSDARVVCIVGDGEMNEGTIWESLLFAAQHKLTNLTLIVDANNYQAMGKTREIIDLEPLPLKLTSFGFDSAECDGHDVEALRRFLCQSPEKSSDKPRALVARTVKGHGVSFMANQNEWHYRRLTQELFTAAMNELREVP